MSSSLVAWWVSRRPYLLSILRIVSAFLFLQFGTAKLFALPGAIMPDGGTAPMGSLPWVAGALETVGGTLYGHAGQGFWPVLNQGTQAVLFCFVWLYFSAAGAGPWALDRVIGSRAH